MHEFSKTLTGLLLGGSTLFTGCAGVKAPSTIGMYHPDADARFAIGAYMEHAVMSDLKKAVAHVFGLVDNGDYIIDHDEAYDAIQLIRPYMGRFKDEILAMQAPNTNEPKAVKTSGSE